MMYTDDGVANTQGVASAFHGETHTMGGTPTLLVHIHMHGIYKK